jgi:hypothetical protein
MAQRSISAVIMLYFSRELCRADGVGSDKAREIRVKAVTNARATTIFH